MHEKISLIPRICFCFVCTMRRYSQIELQFKVKKEKCPKILVYIDYNKKKQHSCMYVVSDYFKNSSYL